jgi:hypothetical protein
LLQVLDFWWALADLNRGPKDYEKTRSEQFIDFKSDI